MSEIKYSHGDLMREVYKASPYFLGKELLGYDRFCETQLEWDAHIRSYFDPRNPTRVNSLVLAPRETYKSSFWTITIAVWLLVNNPNLTILIASESITNADAFLAEIVKRVKSKSFIAVFGNIIDPNCDRRDAVNFITRTSHSKEANIETTGLGKAITGKHFDVILCNDLAGSADRDSAAKRAVTLKFLGEQMDLLKKETGYLQLEGTRKHREDVYAHIITRIAPELERQGLGKFHIWNKPAHDKKTGALNYPRLLSEEKLRTLKVLKQGRDGMDITTYMAEYELEPLAPNEQIFKTFHWFDIAEAREYECFVQWTDPALSDKGDACYSATVVLGKVKGAEWWGVTYASVARREPTKIIKDHNRIYRYHRDSFKAPVDAYMEENGFQLLLKQEAIVESVTDGDTVPTIGQRNTSNKQARIRSLEPYISQGFIRFRKDWETAPEGYRLLLEQLMGFPQGAVDGPDALEGAHRQTQSRFY